MKSPDMRQQFVPLLDNTDTKRSKYELILTERSAVNITTYADGKVGAWGKAPGYSLGQFIVDVNKVRPFSGASKTGTIHVATADDAPHRETLPYKLNFEFPLSIVQFGDNPDRNIQNLQITAKGQHIKYKSPAEVLLGSDAEMFVKANPSRPGFHEVLDTFAAACTAGELTPPSRLGEYILQNLKYREPW
jgi:hypothetical protein